MSNEINTFLLHLQWSPQFTPNTLFPSLKARMHVKKFYSIYLPAEPKFFLWRHLLFSVLHSATLSSGVSENIALGKKSNNYYSFYWFRWQMPQHNTIVSFPNSVSTIPYMYIKTHLVSQLLHITPLHFSEHPMNLQIKVITTTNINIQLLQGVVHSFQAKSILIMG